MRYRIYITSVMLIAEVTNAELAWEIYHKTNELANLLGEFATLIDGDTGEVLAHSDDWDEPDEDYMPEDDDLEMGFDPYMGCYSDDC